MLILSKKVGLLAIFPLLLMLSPSLSATPEIGQKAPGFMGVDSNGDVRKLADFMGKPVILEWTNHQCPYVRKHYQSGNMQRLQRELTEAGAVWISIISSAPGQQGYVDGDKANQLTAMRGAYADMVILDPSGEIGRAYGARTTPQMFLLGKDGVLRYMGAIDDRPSARKSSLKGAVNYVRKAWEAFKAGKPVRQPVTKPYGCTVKYASEK